MKYTTIGVLAHVDAGKTTLSEAMLYLCGSIRNMGRVDHKNAFLDTFELERARGITIFSKQAVLFYQDTKITLLDTPGHIDFSAEMERTLQVLDYAILVVSGMDGVQGHTITLWNLLKRYHIPVFLFVNKMDQSGTDQIKLMQELKERLSDGCIEFEEEHSETFKENIAICEEQLLEHYVETGTIEPESISKLIRERKVFPCFFGSALKLEGVDKLLTAINLYMMTKEYPIEFGAKVFKISRDNQGNRLTFLKITGGCLKVRDELTYQDGSLKEKVNQIRIYSGEKYETVPEVPAGTICAVTGLTKTVAGEGLGEDKSFMSPILEPVLTYQVILPEGIDKATMIMNLRLLEEEEPELHVIWKEGLQEIQVQIMGEIQLEIIKSIIKQRFLVDVEFGEGNILYKETIADAVEGVGHFEPLRHYAEVHLLLEPLEAGSGIVYLSDCNEDILDRNWQKSIMTHLEEREHLGVLTGAPITDMKITLVTGRAHLKHTEGGDFRQATYRAVRQGLKQSKTILLEPFYQFRLEIPESMIGRAMTDIERMFGNFEVPQTEAGQSIILGEAPVVTMRGYQKEVISYSKGHGRLSCTLKGYFPCHNQDEIVEQIGYDSERDLENPTGSVFCAHGAGFIVNWDQVKDYMHIESSFTGFKMEDSQVLQTVTKKGEESTPMGLEEIDEIISRTFYSNTKEKAANRKWGSSKKENLPSTYEPHYVNKSRSMDEFLLVDGYNVIYAWEDLRELAEINIDGARGKLMDTLCNYQAIKKCKLIVVFDAYRVQGHQTEILDYHNIHVVYTKEAETADQYIEKFAHENGRTHQVTVATSDGLEQIIIRGQGCTLISAREFKEEIQSVTKRICLDYQEQQSKGRSYLFDALKSSTREQMESIKEEKE